MYRETVQMLAASQRSTTLPDADFLRIMREFPSLLSLAASARKEGDLTNAIFDVHFPTTIVAQEKTVEATTQKTLQKLTELTQWLLIAGKFFGFTIFGTQAGEGVAPTQTRKPRKRTPEPRKRMKFQKRLKDADGKLRKKLGYGLRRFVVENAKSSNQAAVGRLLKQHTGVALTSGSLSNLYKRLGLR